MPRKQVPCERAAWLGWAVRVADPAHMLCAEQQSPDLLLIDTHPRALAGKAEGRCTELHLTTGLRGGVEENFLIDWPEFNSIQLPPVVPLQKYASDVCGQKSSLGARGNF